MSAADDFWPLRERALAYARDDVRSLDPATRAKVSDLDVLITAERYFRFMRNGATADIAELANADGM